MKKIENKKVSIKGTNIKNYFKLIAISINIPPEGGCDVIEMRKRIKMLDKITNGNESKDSVEFEDSEFKCIKDCKNTVHWGIVSKDIVDFADYIDSL